MAKRITLILLAAIVLLGLVACGQQQGAAAAKADPYGRYTTPVTFSLGKFTMPDMGLPAGDTLTNNLYYKYIQDKLNVTITHAFELQQDSYEQKVALLLASRSIPDALVVTSPQMFRQMVDAGLLADMTSAYNNFISPAVKDFYDSYKGRLLGAATVNGKLYGLPGSLSAGEHNLLWLRKDWLDAVKMNPPKTLDEVLAVVKAFIDKDPGKNGKGKTVGFALDPQIGGKLSSQHYMDTIFGVYGAYPRQWIKDAAGNVVYGSVAPEMKQALATLAKMYADGLIDKEFAVRKADDVRALYASGRSGSMFSSWYAPWTPLADSVTNNKNADWKPYSAPVDANGNLNAYAQNPAYKYLVVRKGYKNPEAIVKVWNLEVEGVRGTPGSQDPYQGKGVSWYVWPFGLAVDYEDAVYRFYQNIKKIVDTGSTEGIRADYVGYAKQYQNNLAHPRQNVGDWAVATAMYDGASLEFAPEVKVRDVVFWGLTKTGESKWAVLQKLEDETLLKIVAGQQPVDSFDDFVTQWKKLGGDQITKEVAAAIK